MTDLMSVVHEISNPLKAGWAVWAAWGVVQVAWYRRARTAAPAAAQPARQPASPNRARKDQMVSLKRFLDAPAVESSAPKYTAAASAPDASAPTSSLEEATLI